MPSSVLNKITKDLFAQALKNQIKSTPLQQVTIQALAKECGFNRRTFYRHFNDIYDLVEWIFQVEILDHVHQEIDFMHWKDGFKAVLAFFVKNDVICSSVFNTSDRKNLEKFLHTAMTQLVKPIIERKAHPSNLSQQKLTFLINFYALSFTAIIIQWVDHGMKETPEIIVENTSFVLQGSIQRVVNSD